MTGTAIKTIAFVLYPGLTPLDLIGPLQALSPLPRIDPTFEVAVVGESTDVLPDGRRHPACAQPHLRRGPGPFAIVVPGGGQPTLAACGNQRLIDYVMNADAAAEIVMSVCTGAIILASAGLLDDRPATRTGRTSTSSRSSGRSTCTSAGWRTASTSRPQASPPASTASSTSPPGWSVRKRQS